MSRLVILIIFALVAFTFGGFGPKMHIVDSMPIHEAYITPVRDIPPLEAVASRPPPLLNETIPPQPDSGLVWIGGYWSWSEELEDYVWTTGIWRRPPPDHIWIPGLWLEYEEGWVWISGFWSKKQESELVFLQKRPPDQLDDEIASPPDSNSIWVQGYWNWVGETEDFEWVQGTWMRFDPDWIFVPAHYVWREKGYVFIDAYWDWPLEQRGAAFSPVYIEPEARQDLTYQPNVSLEQTYIVESLLPYYPDYIYLYVHDFRHRRSFWESSDLCPPWWRWNNWWGLSWSNHWGAWWWYCHPGFVQPTWITTSIGRSIFPPSRRLIKKCKGIRRPTIVTKKGVLSPKKALDAGRKLWGKDKKLQKGWPVFPSRKARRESIGDTEAVLQDAPEKIIEPSGKDQPPPGTIQGPQPQLKDLPRREGIRQRPQKEPRKPKVSEREALPPTKRHKLPESKAEEPTTLPEKPPRIKPEPERRVAPERGEMPQAVPPTKRRERPESEAEKPAILKRPPSEPRVERRVAPKERGEMPQVVPPTKRRERPESEAEKPTMLKRPPSEPRAKRRVAPKERGEMPQVVPPTKPRGQPESRAPKPPTPSAKRPTIKPQPMQRVAPERGEMPQVVPPPTKPRGQPESRAPKPPTPPAKRPTIKPQPMPRAKPRGQPESPTPSAKRPTIKPQPIPRVAPKERAKKQQMLPPRVTQPQQRSTQRSDRPTQLPKTRSESRADRQTSPKASAKGPTAEQEVSTQSSS